MSDPLLELRCPDCDWSELCDLQGMRAWLHGIGKLRRASDPEAVLIVELFRNSRERFTCPECDAVLLIEQPRDDAWSDQRACEGCGNSISPARLQVLPGATMCAACQEMVDRGQPVGEAEYCPRCGGIMELRKTGTGVTRYVSRCSDCGR